MTPVRRCRKPSCRTLIPFTDRYCTRHAQHINQTYDKARLRNNPEYVKFYKTGAWRNTRKVALVRDEWLCQHCLLDGTYKAAEMVDHIIPTLVDWDKRLDLDNLQSLCDACHKVKTREDELIYGKSPPTSL